MPEFIKGLELSESFYNEAARQVIKRRFPVLQFSAGLLGYGSDVLGYDDKISTDHMWGPRFLMFVNERDRALIPQIMGAFCAELPCVYRGYSVNFTEPDQNDCGVRHPKFVEEGPVSPLITVMTLKDFVRDYLGDFPPFGLLDWLSFSEHRLLGLTAGKVFEDAVGLCDLRESLRYYPAEVRLYLIASQWSVIAEEQAFAGRCVRRGDELGSRLVAARITDRLMRLCFLYLGRYAPYSKWFGTAFESLDVSRELKDELRLAVSCADVAGLETHLVNAQLMVGELHNTMGLTAPVEVHAQSYYGRDIRVIYAERFAKAAHDKLHGTELWKLPLFGSLSEIGNLSELSDEPSRHGSIRRFLDSLRMD